MRGECLILAPIPNHSLVPGLVNLPTGPGALSFGTSLLLTLLSTSALLPGGYPAFSPISHSLTTFGHFFSALAGLSLQNTCEELDFLLLSLPLGDPAFLSGSFFSLTLKGDL